MDYIRLTKTVRDRGILIPSTEDISKYIKDRNTDHYTSIFYYTDKQKEAFEKSGTIAGITDVSTDLLVWDFDNEANPDLAFKDARTLAERLIKDGFDSSAIACYFSGHKGATVVVRTKERFTPDEFRNINGHYAQGLSTNDTSITNASRILRVPLTRHQKSGKYKMPLTVEDLAGVSYPEMLEIASQGEAAYAEGLPQFTTQTKLPETINKIKKQTPKVTINPSTLIKIDMDFTRKPKGWSNCKYALLNGHFKQGNRSNALMTIVATCRSMGYPQMAAYYMAKSAAKSAADRTGEAEFPKEEIWTMAETVYGPNWKGGAYSCKDGKTPWLTEICHSLGDNKCKTNSDGETVSIGEAHGLFKRYANEFDQNVLSSGISALDEKVKFMVGTSVGILAPPGVGKTTFSLGMLNHNSKLGNDSIFFSMDMFSSMVYMRLLQKHTGLHQDDIFRHFREDPKKADHYRNILEREYQNVHFNFKAALTLDEMERSIIETQERTGKKIRFIVVDYNELIVTNVSDPTQSSALVAQRLRQMANDLELCTITLLQPSKLYANPSDEATTYAAAKGSSAIAQSLTLMLSFSRPGFHPRFPEDDRFFTINALKNRNGGLFTLDLGWDGLKGSIHEIGDEELAELSEIRQRRKAEKSNDSGGF